MTIIIRYIALRSSQMFKPLVTVMFSHKKQVTQGQLIQRFYNRGLSLTSLLVGMAISGILLSILVGVFASNSSTSRLMFDFGSIQENMRAANDLLDTSLRQAGHFGGVSPSDIENHTGLNITGIGGCNKDWLTNMVAPIRAFDGADAIGSVAGFPAGCIEGNNYYGGTDILSLKYASAMDITAYDDLNNNEIYVRTMLGTAEENAAQIFKGADKASVIGVIGSDPIGTYNFRYMSEIYYVRKCTQISAGVCQDDVPSLVRLQLEQSTLVENVLVSGVEQFQVEFGVDSDGNLAADTYESATSITDWNTVVSVRYSLLIRGDNKDNAIRDTKTYDLVGNTSYTPGTDVQNYRRRAITKVVQLRNMIRS